MAAFGTKRQIRNLMADLRVRRKADMHGRVASLVSDAADSKGTSPRSEFGSAAACLPGVMCYSFVGSTGAAGGELIMKTLSFALCHAAVVASRGVGTVEGFDIGRIQWRV